MNAKQAWSDKKFIRINHRAIEKGLFQLKGSSLKVLLVRLLLSDDSGNCNFSSYWVAKQTGLTHTTALKSERQLENLGWFSFTRQSINGKKRKTKEGKWAKNTCRTNLEKLPTYLQGVFNRGIGRSFLTTASEPTVNKNFVTEELSSNSVNRNSSIKNITKVIYKHSQYYGDPEINEVINYFKKTLNLPILDGSIKENRRYASLTLKKFKGASRAKKLIDLLAKNNFWNTKITSFRALYNNGVRLLSETRRKGGAVFANDL